jgi:hypothetical protein
MATGLNFFDSLIAVDGVSVTSTINRTELVSTIQAATPDTYFDSTNEIGKVVVYYLHQDGRQQKQIIHDEQTHQASVQWSAFARDGTWQKYKIKAYDLDGAIFNLTRAYIDSTSNDVTHSDGTMSLNTF